MKRTITLKLFIIGILTLVICLALFMVNGTISERQAYRDEAIKSIQSSYAGPQTLIGPILVRPYTEATTTVERDDKGTLRSVPHVASLNAISFPQTFDLRGKLIPSERHHGLYNVTVYEFNGHLRSGITIVDPHTTGTITWGEPYLALSVQDVRGIVGTPAVTINGAPAAILQGGENLSGWQPNLHIPLSDLNAANGHLDIAIDMALAGTQQLSIAPIGNSNHVELASTWRSPLFDGQFLPRSRDVGPQGFNASWDLSSLAAGTQLQLQASKPIDLLSVSLLTPIDPYKLSDRATKYGILFVLLTFGGFFLFEMIKQLPIHPIQYLLVGFGLAIFFLLLISFSEHMPFALAYLASSTACIGLLTFYLVYVLQSFLRGLGFGAMLTTLYAAVYGLLISEDNSLILGSLLLFAVLAIVMVVTRRIDWYKTAVTADTSSTPPPPPPPDLDYRGIRLSH